jgi:hypothetical protein
MSGEPAGSSIVLPANLLANIDETAQNLASQQASAARTAGRVRLAGGVSASPVDNTTFLQLTIPPNPSFAVGGLSVSVSLTAVLKNISGEVVYSRWDSTFNILTGLSANYQLTDSNLLSVSITCLTPAIPDGVLYAVCGLTHSKGITTPLDTLLICSYLSSLVPCGWPTGILRTVTDSQGFGFSTIFGGPVVGNTIQYTTVDAYLSVQSVSCVFSTSAIAGNRQVYLGFINTSLAAESVTFCPNTQAASLTTTYYFQAGVWLWGAVGGPIQSVPIPEGLVAGPNGQVSVNVNNFQVGDQLSNLVIIGRAWL